jgi:amino acid transporter
MLFDYKSFITHYIGIPVYVFGYAGYKIIRKTHAISPSEIDFSTGSREFADVDDDEDAEEEYQYTQLTFGQKVLYKIKNW